jgi:hypothetical protein
MHAGPRWKGSKPLTTPLPLQSMLQVRNRKVRLFSSLGADNMPRFDVMQLQEELWSVICQGQTVYQYTTEEEARWAALALASNVYGSGSQVPVAVTPSEMCDTY